MARQKGGWLAELLEALAAYIQLKGMIQATERTDLQKLAGR